MEFSTLNGYKVKDKKAIRYYDTVADMKSDTTLKNGMHVRTKGYYSANDGGHGEYIIKSSSNKFYETLNNTLLAELVISEKLNVKQIGAYNNGTTDTTEILQNMFTKCRSANITSIYFPKGEYLVSDTLLEYGINGLAIYGENDDIYNSTIIMRNADKTIFNFGSVMTLTGITNPAYDLLLKNITFRDKQTTYTENVFATLHYTQHFTIENCTIGNRNKSLDLKQCYDSRFINTDFNAGGNSNDALITIHGGKNASPTEIGWDSANCISFIGCRFERYFGCAIKTTNETQPDTTNPTYNPNIATNVNNLYFVACRFESPHLLEGHHLDFNYTNTIKLDISLTVLDGQPNLQPINFTRCSGVIGNITAGYNQSTVGTSTFVDFSQPLININTNSGKFNLILEVGYVYSHYLLDYFVDITAGDLTRRTMNIQLIYDNKNKKLYNMSASNQTLVNYEEGRKTRYGVYENGYGWKVENNVNNSYFNNMTHDTTNSRYTLQNRYANTSNTNRTNDEYVSNDNYTYHRYDCGSLFNDTLLIVPEKYPSTEFNNFRSNSSSGRAIMYASTYPTAEITGTMFRAGDIILKTAPTGGSNIGWVCTQTGNPGTWKAFGTIES